MNDLTHDILISGSTWVVVSSQGLSRATQNARTLKPRAYNPRGLTTRVAAMRKSPKRLLAYYHARTGHPFVLTGACGQYRAPVLDMCLTPLGPFLRSSPRLQQPTPRQPMRATKFVSTTYIAALFSLSMVDSRNATYLVSRYHAYHITPVSYTHLTLPTILLV